MASMCVLYVDVETVDIVETRSERARQHRQRPSHLRQLAKLVIGEGGLSI